MKRIGLIGGMSVEPTLNYYDRINYEVNRVKGGLVSADIVLRSVNFEEYSELMEAGDWDAIENKLVYEAVMLENYGCDYIALCANTMHKVSKRIEEVLLPHDGISPFVHIGDCVAEKCLESEAKRVAIIGTRTTMLEPFMRQRLEQNGLTVVNPFRYQQIEQINTYIFEELCRGVICYSVSYLRDLCQEIAESGEIDGIVLGCTELGTAFDRQFTRYLADRYGVRLFDTTQAHIAKLVELSLS